MCPGTPQASLTIKMLQPLDHLFLSMGRLTPRLGLPRAVDSYHPEQVVRSSILSRKLHRFHLSIRAHGTSSPWPALTCGEDPHKVAALFSSTHED